MKLKQVNPSDIKQQILNLPLNIPLKFRMVVTTSTTEPALDKVRTIPQSWVRENLATTSFGAPINPSGSLEELGLMEVNSNLLHTSGTLPV